MSRYVPIAERVIPPGYLTPSCTTGLAYPDSPLGHPDCNAPGYEHPVLGWVAIPCECPCHTATEEPK
jgi:hypothetical protein